MSDERHEEMAIHMREARAGSDSRGYCRKCGGAGVVAMTGRMPYVECDRCKGSGDEPAEGRAGVEPPESQAESFGKWAARGSAAEDDEPDPMLERPTVLVNAMAHAESQALPWSRSLVEAFEQRGELLASAHQRIGWLRSYAASLETEALLLIAEGLYQDSGPAAKLWWELSADLRAGWIELARKTRRASRIIMPGALDKEF